MTEWKIYKLSDICDLVAGFAFKSKDFGDYPNKVIKIADIQPPTVNINDLAGVDLSAYNPSKLQKFIVSKGDYVLAMTGATIGKLGRITNEVEAYINQRVLTFRPNESIVDKDYLYYQLCSVNFNKYILNHIDSETAQPNISAGSVGGFEITLPGLEEQRRIAGILGAIDDKIENNRRINANLESQAQALYKQWFVDFNFPNEEGKPYKSSGGKMVDSALGPIPEGWIIQTFGDLIKPQKGKNITRAQVTIGNVPVVAGGLLPSCYHNTSNTHSPVVTVSASGANAGYVNMYHIPIWAADCSYIDDTISKYVHYAYIFLTYNQTLIYHKQQGCAQPHIYPSHLMELQLIRPATDVLDKFEDWCTKLYKQIGANIRGNETLATLRDTLLPKLMNGEIKL